MMDRRAALARLDGDATLLEELIALLLRNTPALMEKIREVAAREDAAGLMHAVHTLKGLAHELCARSITDAAQQIEEIGRRRRWTDLPRLLADLERQLPLLLDRLTSADEELQGPSASVDDTTHEALT
jgi:HPt (histidine-containing phosphotransfer) domain-containing protein